MNCHESVPVGNISSITNASCNGSCTPQLINIICYKMIIPPTEKIIAQQYDVNSNIKTFILPLTDENGVSWADKSFYIITKYDKVQIKGDNLVVGDNYITLKWIVDEKNTTEQGQLDVQIEIFGDNYQKYTQIGTFEVFPTINIDQQIIDSYPTVLQQIQEEIDYIIDNFYPVNPDNETIEAKNHVFSIKDKALAEVNQAFIKTEDNFSWVNIITEAMRGVALGVASLNNDGKLPQEQLPDSTVIDPNYTHTDNNFTTAEKNKLNAIESGAEVNKIDTISVNGENQEIIDKNVDITIPTNTSELNNDNMVQYTSQELTEQQKQTARNNIGAGTSSFSGNYTDLTNKPENATEETDGFMSSEDKTKLDGIEDKAQVNVIEKVSLNGTEQQVADKTISLAIDKTTVGLGNVNNTSDLNKPISTATQNALDKKLDKTNADISITKDVSIETNGDNVYIDVDYKNLNSGAESQNQRQLQLATDTQAGLMSMGDYAQIRDNTSRIEQLENKTVRLLYTASTNPTAAEINAFVISKGYSEPFEGIAVVVDETYHIWHYYEGGIGWKDDGADTVSQFTNANAGIILGSDVDGKVYAETDGTGSVKGWGDLKGQVSDLSQNKLDKTSVQNQTGTSEENPISQKAATDGINTVQTNLTNHIDNKENPHEVTKEQVGLGNTENGAQINTIESISVNGTAVTPDSNKNVDIPQASNTVFGVIRGNIGYGVAVFNGIPSISSATNAQIDIKENNYKPIVPANFDYAMSTNYLVGTAAPTTSTVAPFVGALYVDTTNGNTYQCTVITTGDTPTYTWVRLVRETNYATASKSGVVKIFGGTYGIEIASDGGLKTVPATNSDIDAKTAQRKPIVPNNLDYAVNSVEKDLTTATSTSGTVSLLSNKIYKLTAAENITFSLPTIETTDTKYHVIEVIMNVTADVSITWGTSIFFNDSIPDIGIGTYDLIFEYNGTNWVVGVLTQNTIS